MYQQLELPVHLQQWPSKCDCGCGRAPIIIFNRHFFHEWSCTGGYQITPEKEEKGEDDAQGTLQV